MLDKVALSFFLLFFFNFHFFKTVIFGYFWFLAKNTPKLQKLFKKRQKSWICLIIFHISSKKNQLFDVDLFSRSFDMESPSRKIHYPQIYDRKSVAHQAAIFTADRRCCRPVDKIRNFEKNKLLVSCLSGSIGTGWRTWARVSLREFSISYPPCVEPGKADCVYFIKYWSAFLCQWFYN